MLGPGGCLAWYPSNQESYTIFIITIEGEKWHLSDLVGSIIVMLKLHKNVLTIRSDLTICLYKSCSLNKLQIISADVRAMLSRHLKSSVFIVGVMCFTGGRWPKPSWRRLESSERKYYLPAWGSHRTSYLDGPWWSGGLRLNLWVRQGLRHSYTTAIIKMSSLLLIIQECNSFVQCCIFSYKWLLIWGDSLLKHTKM